MLKFPPDHPKKEQGGQFLPSSLGSCVDIEHIVTLWRHSASQRSLPKGTVQLWRRAEHQGCFTLGHKAGKAPSISPKHP